MKTNSEPTPISDYLVYTELLTSYEVIANKRDAVFEEEFAIKNVDAYQPEIVALAREFLAAFARPGLFAFHLYLELKLEEAISQRSLGVDSTKGVGSTNLSHIFSFAGAAEDIISSKDVFSSASIERLRDLVGRIVMTLILWRQSQSARINLNTERPEWTKEMELIAPFYSGFRSDGDPIAFLKRHYGRWISDGRLTQTHLRIRDEKLFNALKYATRGVEIKLADIVPTRTKGMSAKAE